VRSPATAAGSDTGPDRLAASGHLTVRQEEGGRRRKVFSLTAKGRQALDEWLVRPVEDVFEMRDEAVLQLFFSDHMSTEALVRLARREIELYERRLELYADIAALELPRHGEGRRMAPSRLGVKLAQAFREFWEEVAEDPPRRSDPRGVHDDGVSPRPKQCRSPCAARSPGAVCSRKAEPTCWSLRSPLSVGDAGRIGDGSPRATDAGAPAESARKLARPELFTEVAAALLELGDDRFLLLGLGEHQ
jgi:hypothetical protein